MRMRNEFKELLFAKKFDRFEKVNTKQQEYKEYIEGVDKFVSDNLPSKLYRYRSLGTNHLLSFINGEIYLGAACNFNDPFDSMPIQSITDFYLNLKKKYESRYLGLENTFGSERISMLIKHIISAIRNEYKIACFSENPTNTLMWAHYAEGHRGFCLEYEIISNIIPYHEKGIRNNGKAVGENIEAKFYPMIYTENRCDFSAEVENLVEKKIREDERCDPHKPLIRAHLEDGSITYDDDFTLRMALLKDEIWSYEDEWRLVCRNYLTDKPVKLEMKPSKIILGMQMPKDLKESMIKIARSKGIGCQEIVAGSDIDSLTLKDIKNGI